MPRIVAGRAMKSAGRASIAGRKSRDKKHRVSLHRFEAIMIAAERSGLLKQKSSRIAGRISPALLKQAKKRTGIETDTDLIEFALANIALEDDFAESFKDSRGKVDAELKLGF